MATVVRFRHGHARMTAVLGDHAASHRAHSAGLHDAAPHQVCPLSALSAYLHPLQPVTSVAFDCFLPTRPSFMHLPLSLHNTQCLRSS